MRGRARRAAMRSLLAIGIVVECLDGQEASTARFERGVAAYEALDFTATIVHLRTGLALPGARHMPDSVQAGMLGYLGAAEFMSGRVAAAREAFRDALERMPLFRLDTLVFPPLLTNAFESLRSETLFVTITMLADSAPPSSETTREFLLRASFPHRVIVIVEYDSGRLWKGLYDGEIRDTLRVSWRDADASEFTIEVVSLSGRVWIRRVRVPLRVERVVGHRPYTPTVSRP